MKENKLDKIEQLEAFLNFRSKGMSINSIVKELGGSKTTYVNWTSTYSDEIKNRAIMIRESMFEKFHLTLERQYEYLSTELEAVEASLDSVDYSQLSLEKRINLKLKLLDRISNLLSCNHELKSTEDIEFEKQKKQPTFHERIYNAMKYPQCDTGSVPNNTDLGENDE